jgi:predicted nucleic acid-binding protein
MDTLLAATAVVHELVFVTRNESDVEDLPVKLFNPRRKV